MVRTNICPSTGITAAAVGAMVPGARVVDVKGLPEGMVAADGMVDARAVPGVRAVDAMVVDVKDGMVEAVAAKVEVAVARAAVTPGNPRLAVLPHPRSEAAAEGADRTAEGAGRFC
jgi:hypothetical protein